MKTLKTLQVAVWLLVFTLTLGACNALAALGRGDIGGAIAEGIKTGAEVTAALSKGEIIDEYSPEQEYYMGRGVTSAVVSKFPSANMDEANTREQVAYLNQMAGYIYNCSLSVDRAKLGGHVERSEEDIARKQRFNLFKGMHVGIMQTDEVMAFAMPGGFLWISRGMIKLCVTEDELAAVIAHEIGHIVMNHGMDLYRDAHNKQVEDSRLFGALEAGAGDSELGKAAVNFGKLCGSFFEGLLENGYPKAQEMEADNFGTRALAASGYDPKALLQVLREVETREKKNPTEEKYLKNHPKVEDRVKAVDKVIKDAKLKTPSPDSGKAAREKRYKEVWAR